MMYQEFCLTIIHCIMLYNAAYVNGFVNVNITKIVNNYAVKMNISGSFYDQIVSIYN